MVTAASRFGVRPEEIAWKVLDGETIIINLMNGMYYSLPGVGSEAWELIGSGHSVGEVASSLAARYGAAPDVVTADITRLAEELLLEKLIYNGQAGGQTEELATGPTGGSAVGEYRAPTLQTYRDMADLLALDPPTPGMVFPDFDGTGPAQK